MTQKTGKNKTKDKVLPKKQNTLSELTPQQDKFARLIAEGNLYFEAYKEAYPKSVKWKGNSVYVESSKMMANPKISQRVKELIAIAAKSSEVTLIEVLEEIANWVRLDPIDFMDEDGCVKKLSEMTPKTRKCLSSPIEVLELYQGSGEYRKKIGELKTIKFVDRIKASDMMMKKLGAYITNLTLDVKDLSHIKDIIDGISEA